jgi:hypothetical protein
MEFIAVYANKSIIWTTGVYYNGAITACNLGNLQFKIFNHITMLQYYNVTMLQGLKGISAQLEPQNFVTP